VLINYGTAPHRDEARRLGAAHFFDKATEIRQVLAVLASMTSKAQCRQSVSLAFGRLAERLLNHTRHNLKVVRFQHGDCAVLNRVVGRFQISGHECNFR